ncbi:MAG: hypothetical protein SGJ16_05635 [Nitrospirota bacterium]|nr:hypothetical protein [Nitrospirota bacterium]
MKPSKSSRSRKSAERAPYADPSPEWKELRKAIIRSAAIVLRNFTPKTRNAESDMTLLKQLLDKLVWAYTEAPGKYRGNPLWSIGAVRSYKKWRSRCWKRSSAETGRLVPDDDRLVQEYVAPREHVVYTLVNLANPTERMVGSVLRKLALAVIVTRKENKKLPRHSNDPANKFENDPWVRYMKVKIRIVNHRQLSRQVLFARPGLLAKG